MNKIKELTESQKESLSFYVTNDYLMINNFLYGDLEKMYNGAIIANKDAKGVMSEAREMGFGKRWGVSDDEGEKIYKKLENRTFEELNTHTKEKLLKRIINDVKNIEDSMTPNKEEIVVYRNVLTKNFPTNLSKGQILEFNAYTSTSLEVHKESYRHDTDIMRFVIKVPKDILLLNLMNYPDIANEKDEVILHPLKCKIEKIIDKSEHAPKIIEVMVSEMIKINNNLIAKNDNPANLQTIEK